MELMFSALNLLLPRQASDQNQCWSSSELCTAGPATWR